MKIGLAGSANQTSHIKEILGTRHDVVDLQDVIERRGTKIGKIARYLNAVRDVDIIYNVGTYYSMRFRLAKKCLGKPIVTHWIGTDVKNLSEGILDKKKLSYVDLHLVCFEQLQEELYDSGVEAEVLPIVPAKVNYDICEMPRSHAVMCYIPTGREELYGCDEILAMARKYPKLPFYVVANENQALFERYSNVNCLGRVSFDEMTQLYNMTSILLRPTKHDGLSLMVLEALGKGKWVVWSQDFPFAYPGANMESIEKSMTLLQTDHIEPAVNTEAHDYIVKHFSPQAYLETFEGYVERIMEKSA